MSQGPGASPELTFAPRERLQCENLSSFEPQQSVFRKIPNLFLAYFNPLLQFRTRRCLIRGLLTLEATLSTGVLQCRRLLTLLKQMRPLAFRHDVPAEHELRCRRVNGATGRAGKQWKRSAKDATFVS